MQNRFDEIHILYITAKDDILFGPWDVMSFSFDKVEYQFGSRGFLDTIMLASASYFYANSFTQYHRFRKDFFETHNNRLEQITCGRNFLIRMTFANAREKQYQGLNCLNIVHVHFPFYFMKQGPSRYKYWIYMYLYSVRTKGRVIDYACLEEDYVNIHDGSA